MKLSLELREVVHYNQAKIFSNAMKIYWKLKKFS